METSDWIATAAVLIALAGLVVAIFAAVYARRSAASARRSADEAARLGDIESDRRAEERERWHHDHEPDLPGEVEAKVRSAGSGARVLYAKIAVPRVYQVRAYAKSGHGTTQIALDSPTKAGQTIEFVIEQWPPDRRVPQAEEIVFRFWPPARDAQGKRVWTCDCGRPAGESGEEPAHWERAVKVHYRQPPRMRSF